MILLDSKDIPDAQITATTSAVVSDDPPPAYVDSTSPIASGSGSGSNARRTDLNQTRARPTNFLSLIRSNGPINGSYTIDPRVRVPPALLPETSEPRRNLYLETKSAPIDVDIFVLGDATSKVDIQLEANGPITARIHAASEDLRPCIHITARSDRSITVSLPRDFRGPLSIFTPHFARLPPDVTIFTEVQDTRRGFVGDFSDWTEESVGDSLTLTSAGGTVTVQCEGEVAGLHAVPVWNPFNAWAQMGAARRGFHAHGALPRMTSPSHPLARTGFSGLGSLPHWPPGPIHPLSSWTGLGVPSLPPGVSAHGVPPLPPRVHGGFPGTPPPVVNASQSPSFYSHSPHPSYGFPSRPPLDLNGSQPSARTSGPSPRGTSDFPGGFGSHNGLHSSGHGRSARTRSAPDHNPGGLEDDFDTLRSLNDLAGTHDGHLDALRNHNELAGTYGDDPDTLRPDLDMIRSLHDLNLGSPDGDHGHPDATHHVDDVLERTPSLGLRPRRLRSRSRPSLSRGSRAPRPLAT